MEPGQTFAHYQVTAKLGQGGMGEVFRAKDTRLGRDVALKVLPDQFARDPERLARFRREAQVLASLNHPGIAAIYGLDSDGGDHALAMELVAGPDLAERLKAGPLPRTEALQVAIHIAEAMAAAHDKGIIHRDLKPANVKITAEGRPKILDFGLAKALVDGPAEGADFDPVMSPTLTANMTMQGVILGTAAYMSPEQARGQEADRQADVWAFGCLMYEMLTGKHLFAGDTISDTLAAVLRKDPDWSMLPDGLDPAVHLVLRRCLAREPNERLQHIGDARILLGETLATAPVPAAVGGAPRGVVIGLVAALVLSLGWIVFGPSKEGTTSGAATSLQAQHLAASLAPRAPLARARAHPLGIGRPTLAVAPDGSHLVYVAEIEGGTQLYTKRFDEAQAAEIPGTEGGFHPVYSPSGEWIAYFTADRLCKVLVAGSEPVTLCEVRNPVGLDWRSEQEICVSEVEGDVLVFIDAGAGTKTGSARTTNAGAISWLDGPDVVLAHEAYVGGINPNSWNIVQVEPTNGNATVLVEGGFSPRYVPTGHLVYVRGGNLMGVGFDLETMQVRGRAVPVVAGLRIARRSLASYDFADNGTLVYVSGPPQTLSRLVWVDRQGTRSELPLPPQFYGAFQVSPDGRLLAVTIGGERNDIWIYDIERGSRRKLTTAGDGHHPIWSPDGQRVAFASGRSGTSAAYVRNVDGSGEAAMLAEGIQATPYVWLPDDQIILSGGNDIYAFDLNAGHLEPLIATDTNEWGPDISPDGRWMAYTSDESGRYEVYIMPFPALTGAWAVSSAGGEEPIWSRDGKSLFYRNQDTWLESKISTEPDLAIGRPEVTVRGPYINVPGRSYDVGPDDKRLLVILDEGNEEYSRHVEVVLDWFSELKRLVPDGSP